MSERVVIAPGDHPHHGKEGVVIDTAPCALCEEQGTSCGYGDVIVRLDDGTVTRIYEPEAMPSGYLDEAE